MQDVGRQGSGEDELTLEGRVFGDYVLGRMLGAGGMATVYEAWPRTRRLTRPFAIKLVHPHLASDRRYADMLRDEAAIASRIDHANVCPILDAGEHRGIPFLVMPYLDGSPLSVLMRRQQGPIDAAIAARSICDAARGLHAAHELRGDRGEPLHVVHRDVSPQNVFVQRDGHVRVLDFGIARARGRLVETTTGSVKGKLSYMAPEQLHGRPLDRRTDVWALGLLLYECTTGQHPFRGDGASELVLDRHRRVPPPGDLVKGYPEELDAIVVDAMRSDPDDRISSAAALAHRLERYLYGRGEPTGPVEVAAYFAALHESAPAPKPPPAALMEHTAPRAPAAQVGDGPRATIEAPADRGAHGTVSIRPQRTRSWVSLGAVGLLAASVVVGVVTRGAEVGAAHDVSVAETARTPTAPPAPAPPALTAPPPPLRAEVASAEATLPPVMSPPPSAEPPRQLGSARPAATPRSTASTSTPRIGPSALPVASTEPGPRSEGRLRLLTVPASEVFIDGRSLGTTPLLEVNVPVGEIVLHCVPRDGSPPRNVPLTIRAGETIGRTVRLASLAESAE